MTESLATSLSMNFVFYWSLSHWVKCMIKFFLSLGPVLKPTTIIDPINHNLIKLKFFKCFLNLSNVGSNKYNCFVIRVYPTFNMIPPIPLWLNTTVLKPMLLAESTMPFT